MYDNILAELRLRCREGTRPVAKDDIDRWSASFACEATEIFDLLARELAADFFTGFLGWQFVDGIANVLWQALLNFGNNIEWPGTFEEFYLAFDNSERRGLTDRELIRPFLERRFRVTG